MRSSRTKVEAGAAHDGVAVATAGGAAAAAVAGTAMVEVATAGSASGNIGESQRSSRGSNSTSSSGGGSGGGSCNTPPGRCWCCRQRGRKREKCNTKESDFVPRCARCSGFGHGESACPSDATILVMDLADDGSEEEHVFAANTTGKGSLRISEEVGDVELNKQVA